MNKKKIFGIFFITVLLVMPLGQIRPANAAVRTNSLFTGGSYEQYLDKYWQVWKAPDSERTYEFFRSHDSAYGHGSYSAGILAAGGAGDMFTAGMVSNPQNNTAQLVAGAPYFLTFYAKSSSDTSVIAYMERADDYQPVTDFTEVLVTEQWQKYVIGLTSNYSGPGLLAFVFGNLPDGTSLLVDGISVFPNDLAISNTNIEGYIGDVKTLSINNIGNFKPSDIEIELPYYDNLTGETGVKKFSPDSINRSAAYFTFPEKTFAGIGRVYAGGIYIGDFNYNVKPRIEEYFPDRVRADEDLTVYGSGFMPSLENSFLVLNTRDIDGNRSDFWAAPHILDSSLKQATYRLPVGVTRGSMYVVTAFTGIDGNEVVNTSNKLSYEVKPVIYGIEWEKTGFNQVGDRIVILGKGISDRPSVIFYNDEGVKVDTKRARVLEISDREVIIAETTTKTSDFNVTVKSGNVESDKATALNFTAKPRLESIKTKNSREVYSSSEKMPAALIGEVIELNGLAFNSETALMFVDFQGVDDRIPVQIGPENVVGNGKSLRVEVPAGAQNGFINVVINDQGSNYLPIEIIPVVLDISPDPVVPGEELMIRAYGVGEQLESATIYFSDGKNNEIAVNPEEIDVIDDVANIYLRAPMAISNQSTGIVVKYDKWASDGSFNLNMTPTITDVSMNTDTGVLVIKGYGFSINPRENLITYKYADEAKTEVAPRAKMIGVYPTEEGQEIRIKVLDVDQFHYGYVSVSVGGNVSNEMNFGPVSVRKIARRIEFVESEGRVMGVLYISGYNFGPEGGVRVGNNWADVHYRSEFFVIAVVEKENVYDNPVIVARPR